MTGVMVALFLLLAWPQQAPNYSVSAQKAATAYFYMTAGVLGGTDITVDGKAACRLRSATYCTVQIGPGKHMIASDREWWGNSFEFESGETYYFRLQVKAFGAAGYVATIWPVASETGEAELRGCTRAY